MDESSSETDYKSIISSLKEENMIFK